MESDALAAPGRPTISRTAVAALVDVLARSICNHGYTIRARLGGSRLGKYGDPAAQTYPAASLHGLALQPTRNLRLRKPTKAATSCERVVMDLTKEREGVEHNVVVIGGSPAGLSAAIRLKQLAAELGMGSRSLRRSPRSARIFCLAR